MKISELKKQKLLARKAGESLKVDAINYVLSTVETIELRNNKQLSDDEVVGTIKKVVSELEETRQMYYDGGKDSMALEAEKKIAILGEYLPAEMSEEEIEAAIDKAIEIVNAQTSKDMGKVMGALKKHGAAIDMGKASKIVKEKLS